MEYPLFITSLIETTREGERRSSITCVMAEAELGPFADFGSPEFFFGKLVDVTEEQIPYFKYAPKVEALFRGVAYRFEELEPSACFKLVRRSEVWS